MLDTWPLHQTTVAIGYTLFQLQLAASALTTTPSESRSASDWGCVCANPIRASVVPQSMLSGHMSSRANEALVEFYVITTLITSFWRSLTQAGVTSEKEPHGLLERDGKWPDGRTLLPWQSGR